MEKSKILKFLKFREKNEQLSTIQVVDVHTASIISLLKLANNPPHKEWLVNRSIENINDYVKGALLGSKTFFEITPEFYSELHQSIHKLYQDLIHQFTKGKNLYSKI